MSFLLRKVFRYGAQRLAADPRTRERAAKAASAVVKEAKQIAREDDRARAAGRAVRRAIDKMKTPGDR